MEKMTTYIGTKFGDEAAQEWISGKKILPTEKWPIHQGNLRDFFVGNSSPVKTTHPHSRVGFEVPQEDDDIQTIITQMAA